MAEITTTQSFSDGDTVTATKLNNIQANASIQPEAITNRSAETTVDQANDLLLMYDASATALKKVTPSDLIKAGTASNLPITGNATIGGTLGVTGNSTLGGTLGVTGNSSLAGTLGVTGNASLAGTLGVTGASTLTGNTSVGGTLGVTGASTLSGNTSVGGTLGVTGASTLSGNTSVGGTLDVSGAITASTAVINVGSGQIYKDASGNVGIGTTSPSRQLSVSGASAAFGITSTAAGGNTVSIDPATASSNTAQIDCSGANALRFNTNSTERLRIDSSGNVGIGTASPLGKLKVTVGDVAPASSGNMNTGVIFESNPASRALNLGTNNSGGYSWINAAFTNNAGVPDNLVMMTGATERLRIDSSGNVGIGTTSPSAKLDVNGLLQLRAYGLEGGQLCFLNPDNASAGMIIDVSSTNAGRIISEAGSSSLSLGQLVGTGGIINFYTSSTERLRIDSTGNVGIGVTAPVNKLEVVGSFGRGAPVTKTADFTLADTENWIIVNKAASTCTVTLPAASSWTGREFTIKTLQAFAVVSATASSVAPRNSATPGTAILAGAAGNWATLVSNGSVWVIMCGS